MLLLALEIFKIIDWHTGVDILKYYRGKLVLKNQREGKKDEFSGEWLGHWLAGR